MNDLQLTLDKKTLSFKEVDLKFGETNLKDVFALKNNKTLSETIEHEKYAKFKKFIIDNYPSFLDFRLGDFLLILKKKKDDNYKLFLNIYGDLEYSFFYIADKEVLNKKGLYAYTVENEIKYIGRCLDSFKKRINQGYGKIYPKNCYRDGQATNCHLNSLITKNSSSVSLWIYPVRNDEEIMRLEIALIGKYDPEWNIAVPYNIASRVKKIFGDVKMYGEINLNAEEFILGLDKQPKTNE